MFGSVEGGPRAADHDYLVRAFEALSSPTRVAFLQRLAEPGFVPDLAQEFGLTRQAVRKHLVALESVGLVHSRPARRGVLPATEYVASPSGLFGFKEGIQALALPRDPSVLPLLATRQADGALPARTPGIGFLLVHGDVPGRWFPLTGASSWVIGRDSKDDVSLPYDPFASARHALVRLEGNHWFITDLHSTNGTRLNLRPILAGEAHPVVPGDLVTVGRSHLLLRDGM